MSEGPVTRRRFLRLGLALPLPLLLPACTGEEAETEARTTLPATPACDDGDDLTPEQTEGPFFTPDSPKRMSLLEPGIEGTKLMLAGSVLTTGCDPASGALLDFWHADGNGEYDNEGYRLRGHQFADERGRYRLDTIVPGLYTGRTRHIHVKVQASGGPVLTTQLYFPREPRNASDGIYDARLAMSVREAGSARTAEFDFVLDVA